jgi:predicted Rossmann fold nucleotide-binding protein DprA/Smf involved in DNA uptake
MVNITQIETGVSRTAAILINPATPACPAAVAEKLQKKEIQRVWATGNLCILEKPLLAFFCSSKCPENVILGVYDLARILRNAGVPILSGFHSPMDEECLDLLLRGEQPIVICPGRSIEGMRIPSAWEQAISDKRLLLLSPFNPKERRLTKALAEIRNSFVAMIASSILVAHASTNGTVHKLVTWLLSSGRRILTLDLAENEALIQNGVLGVPVGRLPSFVKSIRPVH